MQRLCKAFLVLAVLCNSVHCTSDSEPVELPPATREGRNTLGFKVDGKIWLPKGEKSIVYEFKAIEPSILVINGLVSFALTAQRPKESLQMLVGKVAGEGTYGKPTSSSRTASFWGEGNKLYHHTGDIWQVTFTRVDTVERVVSGLFEFDLVTSPPQEIDTVHITEGRFDLKF